MIDSTSYQLLKRGKWALIPLFCVVTPILALLFDSKTSDGSMYIICLIASVLVLFPFMCALFSFMYLGQTHWEGIKKQNKVLSTIRFLIFVLSVTAIIGIIFGIFVFEWNEFLVCSLACGLIAIALNAIDATMKKSLLQK